jgi:hypothetical protein
MMMADIETKLSEAEDDVVGSDWKYKKAGSDDPAFLLKTRADFSPVVFYS